jgi:hypothetical protein
MCDFNIKLIFRYFKPLKTNVQIHIPDENGIKYECFNYLRKSSLTAY